MFVSPVVGLVMQLKGIRYDSNKPEIGEHLII
jgi:hypothetical protein